MKENNSKSADENAMENNNGMLDRITITQLAIISSSIEEFLYSGGRGEYVHKEWRIAPVSGNGIAIEIGAIMDDYGAGNACVYPVAEDGRYDDAWHRTQHKLKWDINDYPNQEDIISWLIETVSLCYRITCKAAADKVYESAMCIIERIRGDLANGKKPQQHQFTDWNGVTVTVDWLKYDKWLVHIIPVSYGLKPDGWDKRKDGMFLWDSVDGGITDLREWLKETVNGFFGTK